MTGYDLLFEPVRIGPVTARNRFFQVPHCNGMGHRDPAGEAAMRGVKAEGGWAVVCTEETEIAATSDLSPSVELRLWDDAYTPAAALIADAIHEHGALAGIELTHAGLHGANLATRLTPVAPSALPVSGSYHPVQARAMTLDDIAQVRADHRAAVRRSLAAGYDLVYVYAGHGLALLQHFLLPQYNHRTDAYGGALANRARLLREVLTDTREECAGRAAVACRLAVGPGALSRQETEDVVGMLAELPDVWDFAAGTWADDSVSSRFAAEGAQEPFVAGLKALTPRPVVGVGRFTSPDTMVDQVRRGVLDFVGAARPSIADPFLPAKIRDGRADAVRECIGCNMCVTGDHLGVPIRCTQNPSMGEEWRRGWHPERIHARGSERTVLVLGAGPAGLEAAMMLGRRGYPVTLTEAGRVLGGRVPAESRLPGLGAWHRVVEYRKRELAGLANVGCYPQSPMTAEDVLEFGFGHVAVATGARWRRDGVGRHRTTPLPVHAPVLTPDDLMAGARPDGERVLVYDDDHYYLGAVLAELLAADGYRVELVTPAAHVSAWTENTLELVAIRRRVLAAGVTVHTDRAVTAVHPGAVRTGCVFTGAEREHPADATVLVTARLPVDGVYQDLLARADAWPGAGVRTVTAIGDAHAPGTIAAAVWAGRHYAETLDADPAPVRRARLAL